MLGRSRFAALTFLGPSGLWLAAFFLLPMATIVLFSFWRVVDYNLTPDFTLRI